MGCCTFSYNLVCRKQSRLNMKPPHCKGLLGEGRVRPAQGVTSSSGSRVELSLQGHLLVSSVPHVLASPTVELKASPSPCSSSVHLRPLTCTPPAWLSLARKIHVASLRGKPAPRPPLPWTGKERPGGSCALKACNCASLQNSNHTNESGLEEEESTEDNEACTLATLLPAFCTISDRLEVATVRRLSV